MPDVEALVFDAYGTLFDVHSVTELAEALAPGRGAALSQLWRAKQLEYTWLGSLMATTASPRADFAAVTEQSLGYALAALGIDLGASEQKRLRDAYLTLAPFPDARDTLAALAPRPRWILSNGTLAMLHPLVAHARLDGLVDGVLSVDAAGIYKPSPRVYQLAVDRLRLPPRASASYRRTGGMRSAPRRSASRRSGSTAPARRSTGTGPRPIASSRPLPSCRRCLPALSLARQADVRSRVKACTGRR